MTLLGIVSFLFASVALDMIQVFCLVFIFLCYLSSIDLSSWGASPAVSTLLFFGGLGLKLTISRRGIMRLSFVFVLISILVFTIGIILVFFD